MLGIHPFPGTFLLALSQMKNTKKGENAVNYYISDPHLGHENIIRMCQRPFASIDEMDDCIMTHWNETVTNADTIFILGDLTFKAERDPEWYLSRLKGKKVLIVGNHDRNWCTGAVAQKYFREIHNLHYIHDGKEELVLCHYPLMSWPHITRAHMGFGHIHNTTKQSFWPLIQQNPLMLNAGVDVNHFRPVTLSQMIDNNAEFKSMHDPVIQV